MTNIKAILKSILKSIIYIELPHPTSLNFSTEIRESTKIYVTTL